MILVTIIAVIAAIIFVSFGIFCYLLFKEERKRTDNMIEITPMLQNAVLEAYEAAEEKGDDFEVSAYRKIYRKLRGKL